MVNCFFLYWKNPNAFLYKSEGKIDSLNVIFPSIDAIWASDIQYSIDPLKTGVDLESFWKIEIPMTIITQYFEVYFFISIKDVISPIDLWRQVGILTGNIAAYQNHKLKKYFSKIQEKRFENSREIFTKILENRESKKVENSRNFSLEKSRERNPKYVI